MKTNKPLFLTAILIGIAAGATQSDAASTTPDFNLLITTAEGVGAFNSTLSGTNVQTFDNLLGVNNNVVWDGVGTFDQLNVIKANVYGGAPNAKSPTGTNYAVEGLGVVKQTTLTLDKASSYFGLYWSAGDGANDLKFFSKGVQVADFTTANLMSLLPKSYYGNPITSGSNAGKNTGEPYGFINFFGDANTTWDKIVFSNNGSSGFEADNYTTRVDGWNPKDDGALPGTPAAIVQTSGGKQTVSQVTGVTTGKDNTITVKVKNNKGVSSSLSFAPSAPAAPAPPMGVMAAFASVIALKGLRRRKAKA